MERGLVEVGGNMQMKMKMIKIDGWMEVVKAGGRMKLAKVG